MPKFSEGQFALGGLAFFMVWLFFVLPLVFQAPVEHSEFWSGKLTDWLLLVFMLVLSIVTGLLYQATSDLRRSTDKLWDAGERQIEAVQKNADRQFEVTQQSITLARDEFLSTHRPKIILREAIIGSMLEGEPVTIF